MRKENRKYRKMLNFKSKIRTVTNEQKIRREEN